MNRRTKEKITEILKAYTKKHNIAASSVILEEYAEELVKNDVIKVVRCKDCKNAYINSFSAQSGIALCKLLTNRANGEQVLMRQDDFCSYGERKDGE